MNDFVKKVDCIELSIRRADGQETGNIRRGNQALRLKAGSLLEKEGGVYIHKLWSNICRRQHGGGRGEKRNIALT